MNEVVLRNATTVMITSRINVSGCSASKLFTASIEKINKMDEKRNNNNTTKHTARKSSNRDRLWFASYITLSLIDEWLLVSVSYLMRYDAYTRTLWCIVLFASIPFVAVVNVSICLISDHDINALFLLPAKEHWFDSKSAVIQKLG